MSKESFDRALVNRLKAGETWADIRKGGGKHVLDARTEARVSRRMREESEAASYKELVKPSASKSSAKVPAKAGRTKLGTPPSKSVPSDRDLEVMIDKAKQEDELKKSGDV